ncbi:MAG: type II toxin-antitoxin system VapC family toxin [Akkermansiaceae bacterium]|nr:type II toxin-antitoxin system VapC family toxin [Akkermansiaceae bacterium]
MENKFTIYLETTIPSFLTARPSGDLVIAGKQEVTRRWWEERKNFYHIVISAFVLDEAGSGDSQAAARRLECLEEFELLEADDVVDEITKAILASGIIPPKAITDAAHIAIASRHDVDFLMTWNCTHIANAEIIRKIEVIVRNCGYNMPIICTPDELFGGGTNDEN